MCHNSAVQSFLLRTFFIMLIQNMKNNFRVWFAIWMDFKQTIKACKKGMLKYYVTIWHDKEWVFVLTLSKKKFFTKLHFSGLLSLLTYIPWKIGGTFGALSCNKTFWLPAMWMDGWIYKHFGLNKTMERQPYMCVKANKGRDFLCAACNFQERK